MDNNNISWPYWEGNIKNGQEIDPNQPIPLTIQIGQDKAQANITLEFQYYEQKKVLDDLNTAKDPNDGLLIDSMSPTDWEQGLAIIEINQDWEGLGGIVDSLYPDVVYKQVLKPREPTQPILHQKPLLCEMYFKDGILGYTQNHPRYFYVEGN